MNILNSCKECRACGRYLRGFALRRFGSRFRKRRRWQSSGIM